MARNLGIKHIAVSSNGSLPLARYLHLIDAGVNDLSISLDACCAADGAKMAGGIDLWHRVVDNIRALSSEVYLTVGVVLTDDNAAKTNEIVQFADGLGVADVRVIPAAQAGNTLKDVTADEVILERHPILKYRIANATSGKPVRGLRESDSNRCGLVVDDMAVCEGKHYPCIIYLREGGNAIGKIDDMTNIRAARADWANTHDTHKDQICSQNCLDVCVDYNNKFRDTRLVQIRPY